MNLPPEIVVVIIAGVVGWSIVSSIVSYLKKQRALGRGDSIGEASPPEASEADEAAARRREELRQLAQGRMQAGARPAPPTQAEPTNLSMAERIARARAKEQYQARVEAMRQGSPAPPEQTQPQTAEPSSRRGGRARVAERQARREAETAARREAELREVARREAAHREAARRRAEIDAQAERQRRAQQQAQRRPAQRPQPTTPLPPPQPTTPRPRTHVEHSQARDDDRIARQTLLGTMPASEVSRGAGGRGTAALLRGRSLREAFILKEVLDKPVALRSTESGLFIDP